MTKLFLSFFLFTYCLFASELKVLNWPEYIDVQILKEFTSKIGIPIKYEIYKNNEQLIDMLESKNSYDIAFPSSSFLKMMIDKKLISKLDHKNLENYNQMDSFFFKNSLLEEYAIPYTWGTTGVIYNSELVKIDTYSDLWSEKFKDKLFILDDMNDMFAVACSVLDIDINTKDEEEIALAYEKLLELIPNIKGVFEDSEKLSIEFKNKNILAALVYNGDVKDIVQNGKYIFLHPKEGALLWIDTIVIDAKSKNMDKAYKFIDFLISKEKSLQNFEELGYAMLNKTIEYDENIYPNEIEKKDLKSLFIGDAQKIYEKYWKMFLKELSSKGVYYE